MRTQLILGLLVFALAATPAGAGAGEESATHDGYELPEAKQTSLGLYVTSAEAYEMWEAGPDRIKILDVRTPEEYIFVGHAEMAWNIPLAFQTHTWDVEKNRFAMKRNPDFVSMVKTWAEPGDTILIMCRSGGRSATAVNALAEAGFTAVYSIYDGMEGDKVKDPQSNYYGKRMKNGWKNSGLPWGYAVERDRVLIAGPPEEPVEE